MQVFLENLTREQREATATAVLSGCGTKITLANNNSTPTIPLHISLGPNLTNPAELACAEAVAKHLSCECGRAVGVSELEGLVLYSWSEDETDGIALDKYLGSQSRPLQGLLLQSRTLEGQPEPLASAELAQCVGQRFEFAAEVPSCA